MNKDRFFFSIGPPKTGTTWLFANLRNHPEVALPRDKEINYYWAQQRYGTTNLWHNLTGSDPHFAGKREKLLKGLGRDLFTRRPYARAVLWDLRYFAGVQDLQWYESLFEGNGLAGDISPKYSELNDGMVAQMKRDFPNARIIISLRDPVERDWSWIRMTLLKNRGRELGQVDEKELLRHLASNRPENANDYVQLVRRWQQHFGESQIMVFYMEELAQAPERLLQRLCRFLEIDERALPYAEKKVLEGVSAPIPPAYEQLLVQENVGYLREMRTCFDNDHVKHWNDKYGC